MIGPWQATWRNGNERCGVYTFSMRRGHLSARLQTTGSDLDVLIHQAYGSYLDMRDEGWEGVPT